MTAYYNEIDPYAAQWLRNLIAAGHIASGDVDERSIVDVQPDDLRPYTQCHFFAGIGAWSHALRSAGWSDDRPVWTGSCPCQPFSAAGKRKAIEDERHLWPAWFRLIGECRPGVVFGEQVANGDGMLWLDHVLADMEGADYAVGAVDLPACGVGAPHIRNRLFFVADAERESVRAAGRGSLTGPPGAMQGSDGERQRLRDDADERGAVNGFWSDAEWVWCRDGKWRAHEPKSCPLSVAARTPARVGRLRAYGNAIVSPVAAEFIRAYDKLDEIDLLAMTLEALEA